MRLAPVVYESVRPTHDQRSTAAWCNIVKQSMRLDSQHRPELAAIMRVDVPTRARDAPLLCAGKGDKERAPIRWHVVCPARKKGIERREQRLTTDRLKHRIILQLLQVCWSFDFPRLGLIAVYSNESQRTPNGVAHETRRFI